MSERKMNCEDCGFTLCRCELPGPPECECPAVAGCYKPVLSARPNKYPNGFEPLMADGDGMMLYMLKLCYRKHVRFDDDIVGWDELSDKLGTVLPQVMGDDEFCKWLEGL